MSAVLTSKARVILTTDNNILPEFWAASFIMGRRKISDILDKNPGPLFIQIGHCGSDHVRIVKQHITKSSQAVLAGTKVDAIESEPKKEEQPTGIES